VICHQVIFRHSKLAETRIIFKCLRSSVIIPGVPPLPTFTTL